MIGAFWCANHTPVGPIDMTAGLLMVSYMNVVFTNIIENSHLKTDKQEIHEKRQQMEIELQKARLALEEANRNQVTLKQT